MSSCFLVSKWIHSNGGEAGVRGFFYCAYGTSVRGENFVPEAQLYEPDTKAFKLDPVCIFSPVF